MVGSANRMPKAGAAELAEIQRAVISVEKVSGNKDTEPAN